MSTYELAKRTDLDQSCISRIESSEAKQEIKLSTLKKMADGLGWSLSFEFSYNWIKNSIVKYIAQDTWQFRLVFCIIRQTK